MELLMGNLLIILFGIGIVLFFVLWVKCGCDGAFQAVFSFYRKRNLMAEWKITGAIVGAVSFLVIASYYGITSLYIIKADSSFTPVPWYTMSFVILGYLCVYLFICVVAGTRDVGIALAWSSCTLALPAAVTILILKEMLLDTYCLRIALVLLIVDGLLLIEAVSQWKKGDSV